MLGSQMLTFGKPQNMRKTLDEIMAVSVEDTQSIARAILTRLSPRETEVARWLALGWANKAIARQLAISEHTVHVHRQHIMDKTDAGSPADLARLILRADPAGLDEAGVAAD